MTQHPLSPLTQINTSNAATLELKWTFQADKKEGIPSQTPLVVDGVMYFNSGKGRTFYGAIGHREDLWRSDPVFRQFMTGAIRWAIGVEH